MQIATSPRLWIAVLFYLALAGLVEMVIANMRERTDDDPVSNWIVDAVFGALSRTAALVVFVAIAYPALFGLANAPNLGTLLTGPEHRINILMNLGLVTGMLLPLIPVLSRRPDIFMPLQAVALIGILISWLGQYYHLSNVNYWPGFTVAGTFVVLVAAVPFLARRSARLASNGLDLMFGRQNMEAVLYEGLLLVFQVPAIVLYSRSLARQFV